MRRTARTITHLANGRRCEGCVDSSITLRSAWVFNNFSFFGLHNLAPTRTCTTYLEV